MNTHKVKWQVGLSNGETFQEGKELYSEIPGELSPWQKLLVYLKTYDLKITSISLFTDSDQHFNLPTLGKNPQFAPFRDAPKPIDYIMFRIMGKERGSGASAPESERDWFTVIQAIYENGMKLQVWVDENNIKNSWSLITF